MPQIDDIFDGEFRDLVARVRKLETASPVGFSSITRGQFRVGGTADQLFDSSGTLTINGTCNGSGAWTWTGTSTLNGPWSLNGAGTISGPTTLSSTLTVTGQIISGTTTLNSAGLSNSTILFLQSPTVACNHALTVTGDLSADANITAPNLPTTSGTANILVTSGGVFQKITSARRFKIDPQPMQLSDALLDVPVKAWIDKGARERGETDLRIPGVIAEEVEAAGGETFVGYGLDGRVESVLYDRLALARTQILAERLDKANQKIADLTEALSGIVRLLERNNTTEETR
jgi:hypothetical protein